MKLAVHVGVYVGTVCCRAVVLNLGVRMAQKEFKKAKSRKYYMTLPLHLCLRQPDITPHHLKGGPGHASPHYLPFQLSYNCRNLLQLGLSPTTPTFLPAAIDLGLQ